VPGASTDPRSLVGMSLRAERARRTGPEVGRAAACRGVSVRYGSGDAAVLALDRVDLDLERGEALALRGPSGSGKTTLLHVLGGLVRPSEGTVSWQRAPRSAAGGQPRAGASGAIAIVFQAANLIPVFTAYENVAFAAYVADEDGPVEDAAMELLGLVGLTAKADNLPAELSGGEAQRVAIARALAQRPRLLLCDEPTGQLDSDTASRVLDLIVALHRRLGFTLAIATHDADVAASMSRVVELRDGRIVAHGG
jgi:putative ABC transport system ATP-binding protein